MPFLQSSTPSEGRREPEWKSSDLFKMLQAKLRPCVDHKGDLNVALVAKHLNLSRQVVFVALAAGSIPESMAFRFLKEFSRFLTLADIKPFVRKP